MSEDLWLAAEGHGADRSATQFFNEIAAEAAHVAKAKSDLSLA